MFGRQDKIILEKFENIIKKKYIDFFDFVNINM